METDCKTKSHNNHLEISKPGFKFPILTTRNLDSDLKRVELDQINQQSNEKEKDKKQDNTLKCPICQINFDSRNRIDEHFATEHEGIKPYHCSLCDARFSKRRMLTAHVSKGRIL